MKYVRFLKEKESCPGNRTFSLTCWIKTLVLISCSSMIPNNQIKYILHISTYYILNYSKMLENSWSNKLSLEPKMATILNIPNPTIIYQATSNQLMAHSQAESTNLPIRKDILGLCSLQNNSQILFLTRYELSCFDLINNNEIFCLEFENAQKLFAQEGFIYVICGCDLFCYDEKGEQQYVNHCSSLIEAIASVDIKGKRQVVIGLNDMTMIRYRGVNISLDYGKVSGLPNSICWIGDGALVGTQEGTVAFYQTKKSKWKAKSHHPVFKVMAFRTETTYLAIIGRKDGLVELKDWRGKGETIHKIKLQQELIGLTIYDFRQENNEQLICIFKSGKITGLNMYEEAKELTKKPLVDEMKLQLQDIEFLQNEKLNLEFQINQLKQKIAAAAANKEDTDNEEILAKNFSFQTFLLHEEERGLGLTIQCINGYISGLIFEEPIMPISIDRGQLVKYYFKAQNLTYGEINCFALVHSNYNSKIYQSQGFKITLPKFWKFGSTNQLKDKIEGGIKFKCVQRNARYVKWISQCFFVKWSQEERTKAESSHTLKLKYYNSYDKVSLEFIFTPKETTVEILCDCLKTLGEVFQDLVEYIGVNDLDSVLWFPKEKSKLTETLQLIERLSQAKVSISSEMADAIENIKFMLVKGESARCVGSMKDMRRTYTDIMGFNRNLMLQIEKKNQNTKQLSESLKSLGQMINQTANVRFGKAKEMVIAGCRQAIKKKEFPKILSIMERGAAAL